MLRFPRRSGRPLPSPESPPESPPQEADRRRGDQAVLALAGMTSRGRAILAAGIAATAAGVVLDQRDLVRIGVLLLALPVAAAIVLTRARYQVSAERRLDRARAPVGSVVRVEIQLRNLSRMATPFRLAQDALPRELDGAAGNGARFVLDRVAAGGQRTVTYTIRPMQRGRHVVGPLSIQLADPFGFCHLSRTFGPTDGLSVLPATVALAPGRLGGYGSAGGDGSQQAVTTGGEPGASTRPYVPGDDRRRVHWRTTARTGELAVRRDEQSRRRQATILIDTRASAHSSGEPSASFEFAVSAAASIAAALVKAGYRLRLVDDVGRLLATSANSPADAAFEVMNALADLPRKASSILLPGSARHSGLVGDRQPDHSIIAVLGSLTAGDAAAAAAATSAAQATASGPRCLALLVDANAWAPGWRGPPSHPESSDLTASRDVLRRAGWTVSVARPQTPLDVCWQELNGAGQAATRRWVG